MNAIHEYNVDAYFSGISMEQKNGKINKYFFLETKKIGVKELIENLNLLYPLICICAPVAKIWKRSIIIDNNIRFDTQMNLGEDTCFNLDCFNYLKSIYIDKNIYYHYIRQNESSLFSKYHRDIYEANRKIFSKLFKLLDKLKCSNELNRRVNDLYFSHLIGCIHEYYKNKDKNTHSERFELIKKISSDEKILMMHFPIYKKIKNNIKNI
jgi:hypothetical protein